VHAQGEILAARAAQAAGIPFTLSTVSICSMEAVHEATQHPFWFQLYVMRDRAVVQDLIARALAVQCPVLVVTVDLAVQAQRHRDVRNGMQLRSRLATPRNVLDVFTKPGWVWHMARAPRPRFGNLARYISGSSSMVTDGPWVAQQLDPGMTWDDLSWIRSLWPGQLVVKGILDVEDARAAVAIGADAIVVSNHGGRQLDGAPSAISVLPYIVEAVNARCEVLFDSGVRSGLDVLKALACGANGALIGRAWLYGLGALGEAGVSLAIDILAQELDTAMALTGTCSVADAGPHLHYLTPDIPDRTLENKP
jgi:L-lactate dehydrogenase (cytochrome)